MLKYVEGNIFGSYADVFVNIIDYKGNSVFEGLDFRKQFNNYDKFCNSQTWNKGDCVFFRNYEEAEWDMKGNIPLYIITFVIDSKSTNPEYYEICLQHLSDWLDEHSNFTVAIPHYNSKWFGLEKSFFLSERLLTQYLSKLQNKCYLYFKQWT